MRIDTKRAGRVVVLHLHGKMAGPDEYALLHDRLDELALQSNLDVIVNMEDVPWIDSTGVGALVRAFFVFRRCGGRLKFTGLNPRVDEVFFTIDLRNIFEVYDSEADAIAAFSLETT
jgi:anti-sigma B factor antagonist